MPLPTILFEDDAIVAFDKPSGMLVAPDRWDKKRENLMDLVHAHARYGHSVANVHRLDADTSGLLLCAKSKPALDYLTGLQSDEPQLAGLAETWEAFRQAGVLAIQNVIARGDWATADAQLARLSQAPGGPAVAAPLAAELAAGRLQELYLATAAPASELTVRSAAPAVYPPGALDRGTEGWVDLEFVVDRTGQPRNLVVQRASPPGQFDAAALAAVGQYRYVPFERDGRVYERRIRLRVRFQLE